MIKRYRLVGLVIICGLSLAGVAISAAAPISPSHSKLIRENQPISTMSNPAQPMAVQVAETWVMTFTVARDTWLDQEHPETTLPLWISDTIENLLPVSTFTTSGTWNTHDKKPGEFPAVAIVNRRVILACSY
jgi:hypothetical protein